MVDQKPPGAGAVGGFGTVEGSSTDRVARAPYHAHALLDVREMITRPQARGGGSFGEDPMTLVAKRIDPAVEEVTPLHPAAYRQSPTERRRTVITGQIGIEKRAEPGKKVADGVKHDGRK